MRNTGWYIPYWRKPAGKKKGKAEKGGAGATEEVWRNDEQLEAVRQRWVERYRRTARALETLGLSVGSSKADAQARYDTLRAQGRATRDVEDAYRYLQRVLPSGERRKKRPQGEPAAVTGAPGTPARTTTTISVHEERETVVVAADTGMDVDDTLVAVDLYAADVDVPADYEDEEEDGIPDAPGEDPSDEGALDDAQGGEE